MVMAVVCCTLCATKFEVTMDRKQWGDMVEVTCPRGHKSKDVLSKITTLVGNHSNYGRSNEVEVSDADFDRGDDYDDGDPEDDLVPA